MRNIRHILAPLLLFCILCCFPHILHAYSLRQFSNKDGLSNSAIASLYQDDQGIIWIGSCDGLNIFNGINIQLYKPNSSKGLLSGNLINHITETEKNVLWIKTNYGLDRLDTKRQTCQSFIEFKDNNHIIKSKDNELFIIKDDGYLYHYQREQSTFEKLKVPQLAFDHVLASMIDSYDVLWIFTSNNDTRSYQIKKTDKGMTLTPNHLFKHSERLLRAFPGENSAYFIDETHSLYEYDFTNKKMYYIADLKTEIETHREVSSIIKQQNDYYIGFKNSGLIILKYMADQKIKYQIQPTKIRSGIFCLMKDKFQDIVWIGTDGQGLYMYYNDTFSITNTPLDTPVYQISQPVRTLYCDADQTLWIGTKGGGILRIKNYSPDMSSSTSFDRITASNSALTNNAVYCFAPSSMDKLWIGTESGINYYSYKERRLKEFPVIADGKKVKYVHSINELNDTTLWIATVGEGLVKVILQKGKPAPSVKSASRIILDDGRMASNYFFTSFQENDSILWFGNRGYGTYHLNVKTEKLTSHKFDTIINSQTINDVFAIHKNSKGYWLGTSSGLLRFTPTASDSHNRVHLFSSNTVHGILEDSQGNLWISTNQGLTRFNPELNTQQTYNKGNRMDIIEFSDGAFYKDRQTETLFFGGTNGFVAIRYENILIEDYMPQIHFNGLSIFGKEHNINDFLQTKDNQPTLLLDYNQNFVCINFIAINYINGNNYSYSYKLDQISENWIESGTSPSAIFSNLSPGQYTLLIKYRNNINGKESQPQTLIIRIMPPWYLSYWAYTIYFILFFSFCIYGSFRLVRKYRRKQHRMIEKMNREKKEEIYESKLRFFTNITHEFCTPLTLIYGPCEKILSQYRTDAFIQKYGQMILQNAEKLNGLILELLEFRRLETDNKTLSIQECAVSDKIQNIASSFNELAENKKLNYLLNIQPNIQWNTDLSCFNKIVNNLFSNAFKYTPDNGTITIELKVDNQRLTLRISNSGKGIKKENLTKIFDRYKILDSFELNGKDSRNGLGLTICKSMITLLNGEISVESTPNEITVFTVVLPELPLTEGETLEEIYHAPELSDIHTETIELEKTVNDFDPSRKTIMIIDDDPSMLWFVSEVFAGKYNVSSFNNANEALASLELKQPDIIISDVMMPDINGLTFAHHIKQNKLWSHIPLILLSALHYEDDQVKGIEAGAEAYITKPFNVEYLEKIANRLIQRKEDLKIYYSSVYSSFKIENGNCIHKEDMDFLNKVMEAIDRNITNPDLSAEVLGNDLGYSTRQFYRKIKPITEKSPGDIIKEYRLTVAERLLVTQKYTIEEIMDKVGFNSRGTFYKLFSLRFGMPPRQYREEQKNNVKNAIE